MLPVHAFCAYRSYEHNDNWQSDERDALKFVKALKGQPFKYGTTLQARDGSWKRFDQDNRAGALEIFGQWGAQQIWEALGQPAYLVPVPSSSCLEYGKDEKGRLLCQWISHFHADLSLRDAFCWGVQLQAAHARGPRDVDTLYAALRLHPDMPTDRPIVLIDDVVTTGGHLRACALHLRQHGCTVAMVVAAAQTVGFRPVQGMFNYPVTDLEPDQW